ncbi:DUF2510 domain-containing protein [Leifsonia sp. NPDC058248]|uniref:DUF2510 domain-containing protein n=1 Tax=Leifsonia sp. NPDC058248 TaxID=3346402 RepID=UPI0036D9DA20
MAEAGWYPDPMTPGVTRYWDGSVWTEHTSGVPAPPPAYPYGYPVRQAVAAPTNKKATTALVLALVSLLVNPVMILSILAIVFGAQGRGEAEHLGRSGFGKVGMAASTWAIVLGIVGCVLFVVIVANYANNVN